MAGIVESAPNQEVHLVPLTGYAPGAFDLFHIGHLNLLSSASEHCDRLVVGVVTDDAVTRAKGRPPVVPFAERLAIVTALRCVDEAVPDPHTDKFESWKDVRYDVLFKGDDWRGTERGNAVERKLAEVDAKVHYFPYTIHTSTSTIRERITGSA